MKLTFRPPPRFDAVEVWSQSTFDKGSELTSLRGNPKSKVLCVAPPPTADDVFSRSPFSSKSAHYVETSLQSVGLSSHDWLVMPSSTHRNPLERFVAPPRKFVATACASKSFAVLLILGPEAFKAVVGSGTCPPYAALHRKVIYPPNLGHIPTIVLPDPNPVDYVETGDRRADRKAYGLAMDTKEKYSEALNWLSATLEDLL